MSANETDPPNRWLTAEQAMSRLRVSRQTLYAYVSRSRIGAIAAPDDPRRSLYDGADVNRLAQRNRTGRSRRAVAASTISWGEPILVSAITRIEGGRLEYRGQDAIAIAAMADLAMAGRWTGRVDSVLSDAARILDRMAWAAACLPGGAVWSSSLPLHQRLASAWRVGPKAADLIR